MTHCFDTLPSDNRPLHHNDVAVNDCEPSKVRLYGADCLVTEVPILTCACLWRIYQRQA